MKYSRYCLFVFLFVLMATFVASVSEHVVTQGFLYGDGWESVGYHKETQLSTVPDKDDLVSISLERIYHDESVADLKVCSDAEATICMTIPSSGFDAGGANLWGWRDISDVDLMPYLYSGTNYFVFEAWNPAELGNPANEISHQIEIRYFEKENDAACSSGGNNIPTTLVAGQTYTMYIDVYNNGETDWDHAGTPGQYIPPDTYGLGEYLEPYNEPSLGVGRIHEVCTDPVVANCLDKSTPWVSLAAGNHIVGQPGWYRFMKDFTAPSVAGSYDFDWQMVEDGVEWFGESCESTVQVVADNSQRMASCTITGPSVMSPGETTSLTVTCYNLGGDVVPCPDTMYYGNIPDNNVPYTMDWASSDENIIEPLQTTGTQINVLSRSLGSATFTVSNPSSFYYTPVEYYAPTDPRCTDPSYCPIDHGESVTTPFTIDFLPSYNVDQVNMIYGFNDGGWLQLRGVNVPLINSDGGPNLGYRCDDAWPKVEAGCAADPGSCTIAECNTVHGGGFDSNVQPICTLPADHSSYLDLQSANSGQLHICDGSSANEPYGGGGSVSYIVYTTSITCEHTITVGFFCDSDGEPTCCDAQYQPSTSQDPEAPGLVCGETQAESCYGVPFESSTVSEYESNCCGDDANENYKRSHLAYGSGSGKVEEIDTDATGACCDTLDDCVYDWECYDTRASPFSNRNAYVDSNNNGKSDALCAHGLWYDADTSEFDCGQSVSNWLADGVSTRCTGNAGGTECYTTSGESSSHGEYQGGEVECCEDDSGEYLGALCPQDTMGIRVCCDDPNDVVIDGICHPNCDQCGNSVWDGNEECDGTANCLSNCECEAGYIPDGSGNCIVAPSCDPDAGASCCDATSGNPDIGVTASQSNFVMACGLSGTESCYEESGTTFEAGNALCCGDDGSEYSTEFIVAGQDTTDYNQWHYEYSLKNHDDVKGISIYTDAVKDESFASACCNVQSDCNWDGTCYAENTLLDVSSYGYQYGHHLLCRYHASNTQGVWTDCDGGNGEQCAAGGLCDLGLSAVEQAASGECSSGGERHGQYWCVHPSEPYDGIECCGDDAGEVPIALDCNGDPVSTVCCDSSTDRVENGVCVSQDSCGGCGNGIVEPPWEQCELGDEGCNSICRFDLCSSGMTGKLNDTFTLNPTNHNHVSTGEHENPQPATMYNYYAARIDSGSWSKYLDDTGNNGLAWEGQVMLGWNKGGGVPGYEQFGQFSYYADSATADTENRGRQSNMVRAFSDEVYLYLSDSYISDNRGSMTVELYECQLCGNHQVETGEECDTFGSTCPSIPGRCDPAPGSSLWQDGTAICEEGCTCGSTYTTGSCIDAVINSCGNACYSGAGCDLVTCECDPGYTNENGICVLAPGGCGNLIIDDGEGCDDGNTVSGDGCSSLCIPEECGDGVVQVGLGEQCDDGNLLSEDGCSVTCQNEYCGDGITQGGLGEECDSVPNCHPIGTHPLIGTACHWMHDSPCGTHEYNVVEQSYTMLGAQDCREGLPFTPSCTASVPEGFQLQLQYATDYYLELTDGAYSLWSSDGSDSSPPSYPPGGPGLTWGAYSYLAFVWGSVFVVGPVPCYSTFEMGQTAWYATEALATSANNGYKSAVFKPGYTRNLYHYVADSPGQCYNNNRGSGVDVDVVRCDVCGDGVVDAALGEACDDGDKLNSDGCNGECQLESCGDGVTQGPLGEECDDGVSNSNTADACRTDCSLPDCGDGIVDSGELCDDGNLISGDGCNEFCQVTSCGDGIVQAPEECDDADADNTDYCVNTCLFNYCGDGYLYTGIEECDDSNTVSGDGCSATCETEYICNAFDDGCLGTDREVLPATYQAANGCCCPAGEIWDTDIFQCVPRVDSCDYDAECTANGLESIPPEHSAQGCCCGDGYAWDYGTQQCEQVSSCTYASEGCSAGSLRAVPLDQQASYGSCCCPAGFDWSPLFLDCVITNAQACGIPETVGETMTCSQSQPTSISTCTPSGPQADCCMIDDTPENNVWEGILSENFACCLETIDSNPSSGVDCAGQGSCRKEVLCSNDVGNDCNCGRTQGLPDNDPSGCLP